MITPINIWPLYKIQANKIITQWNLLLTEERSVPLYLLIYGALKKINIVVNQLFTQSSIIAKIEWQSKVNIGVWVSFCNKLLTVYYCINFCLNDDKLITFMNSLKRFIYDLKYLNKQGLR